MIQYPTLSLLRRFGNEVLAEEQATLLRKSQERSPTGSTFLSHSTQDTEYLPGVISLLEGHGGSVYVDKKDEKLPPTTSRETAAILRSRIFACRKFVLFATKNSKDSRWMPWELGIADGIKGTSRLAILPGLDSATDTSWTTQEYLGLYDRVVWGDLGDEPGRVWMVLNQEKNTAITLAMWLSQV